MDEVVRERLYLAVASHEQMADFYLQDGMTKVFINGTDNSFMWGGILCYARRGNGVVEFPYLDSCACVHACVFLLLSWDRHAPRPGSNRGSVRVQGEVDVGGDANTREYYGSIPPGIKWVMAQNNVHGIGGTGRMRFFQSSFDVNEMIAALGHVVPAMDPFTGAPCKFLMPVNKDSLNEKYDRMCPSSLMWRECDVDLCAYMCLPERYVLAFFMTFGHQYAFIDIIVAIIAVRMPGLVFILFGWSVVQVLRAKQMGQLGRAILERPDGDQQLDHGQRQQKIQCGMLRCQKSPVLPSRHLLLLRSLIGLTRVRSIVSPSGCECTTHWRTPSVDDASAHGTCSHYVSCVFSSSIFHSIRCVLFSCSCPSPPSSSISDVCLFFFCLFLSSFF